ncbi:MAG: 1,4-dihydroxy-2-naphthoate octaprenyltransferase [Akkermansiaceae bacterium]|nr:1,4-dihydroxy-2-naphthoate octaprenyltransferase [Akkermansiaceae bacterium]
MNTIKSIFLAARPKTLPAGIVAVWAGCMIVWKFQHGSPAGLRQWQPVSLNWTLAVYTLLSAVCIQIACNLFNDSLDSDKKADTAKRQGPRRITASGAMSSRAVKIAGCAFLAAAAGFSIPLIVARGWPIIAIGIPSMLCAYCYTGGPYPLAYKGLGELFVLLFFGLIAVMGTVYVQIGFEYNHFFLYVYGAAFIVGMQCGLLSCLLIEINNIRDRKEDATTGKRTLAVRLGDKRARGLALAFLIAPYATLKHTDIFLPGVSWNLCWLAAILCGGFIILKISKTPADKRMNMLLGLASLHLILFLLALTLGSNIM